MEVEEEVEVACGAAGWLPALVLTFKWEAAGDWLADRFFLESMGTNVELAGALLLLAEPLASCLPLPLRLPAWQWLWEEGRRGSLCEAEGRVGGGEARSREEKPKQPMGRAAAASDGDGGCGTKSGGQRAT